MFSIVILLLFYCLTFVLAPLGRSPLLLKALLHIFYFVFLVLWNITQIVLQKCSICDFDIISTDFMSSYPHLLHPQVKRRAAPALEKSVAASNNSVASAQASIACLQVLQRRKKTTSKLPSCGAPNSKRLFFVFRKICSRIMYNGFVAEEYQFPKNWIVDPYHHLPNVKL